MFYGCMDRVFDGSRVSCVRMYACVRLAGFSVCCALDFLVSYRAAFLVLFCRSVLKCFR